MSVEKWYLDTGKLLLEQSFKDGKKDGIFKLYGDPGEIMIEESYKDGKLNGITQVVISIWKHNLKMIR